MARIWIGTLFGLLCLAMSAGCGETPKPAAEELTGADSNPVELSPEEIRALSEEQKDCPVSGEPLGSMGTPIPVRVTDSAGKDHTVLICCESCRESVVENPDKFLAELASKPGAAATE